MLISVSHPKFTLRDNSEQHSIRVRQEITIILGIAGNTRPIPNFNCPTRVGCRMKTFGRSTHNN